MKKRSFLGEFEQTVLLSILQQGDQAFGLEVRRELERSTGKSVSRGAFYTTLDRLERKGLVTWSAEAPGGRRGGAPQRLFKVSNDGLDALRACRRVLLTLWRGLEEVLKEP